MITQAELKKLLNYDAETGIFTWKINRAYNVKADSKAGCMHSRGYIRIRINYKTYEGHRLAWLYHYGSFPNNCIDHINGCPSDNRIINLREATKTQNAQNMKLTKRNKSGVKGVDWHKSNANWRARCQVDGKRIELGSFNDIKLAEIAINEARLKYHKEFARHV
jgi:hypothetical protein